MDNKKFQNCIELKTHHREFRIPDISFSVSSRKLLPEMSAIRYLRIFYIYTDLERIESVFGNTVFPSKLYGGRPFRLHRSLTDAHVGELEDHGIHLSLTLTNHFFDDPSYQESHSLLKAHHKMGNSVICTNDELAIRIKNDFPDYFVKASIIKNINTPEKVDRYLSLYDAVTIPMDKNDHDSFLSGLQQKDRIILFANATCAYMCPDRTCYLGFSETNRALPATSVCSKNTVSRLDMGHVFFNVKKYRKMGFRHFKLIPLAPNSATNVAVLQI